MFAVRRHGRLTTLSRRPEVPTLILQLGTSETFSVLKIAGGHFAAALQSDWPRNLGVSAVKLPSSFGTDEHDFDTNSILGFSFMKDVEPSHWSRKKGYSGRNVMDIRSHELMFHVPAEWSFRFLSHGRFLSTVAFWYPGFCQLYVRNSVTLMDVLRACGRKQTPGKVPTQNLAFSSISACCIP